MTGSGDPEHPLTRAFELAVLVPIGLATVVCEELRRLAEHGRRRVDERIVLARLVGEVVVRQGRREVERRLVAPTDAVEPSTERTTPANPAPERTGPERTGPRSTPSNRTRPASTPTKRAGAADSSGAADSRRSATPTRRTTVTPTRRSAGAPSSAALPLEDYESLAAGHVVSLLADLSPDELDLVEAFESAHRNRRTVLGRISQLRSGT